MIPVFLSSASTRIARYILLTKAFQSSTLHVLPAIYVELPFCSVPSLLLYGLHPKTSTEVLAFTTYVSIMASFKALCIIGALVSYVRGQTTITANIEHSAIPSPYPKPYEQPHYNVSWIQKHNQTWFDSSEPNSAWSNATDSNGNFEAAYYPGRAPAIPLAVRSPYTSTWASTANNGSLNSQYPIFWWVLYARDLRAISC